MYEIMLFIVVQQNCRMLVQHRLLQAHTHSYTHTQAHINTHTRARGGFWVFCHDLSRGFLLIARIVPSMNIGILGFSI